MPRRVLTSLFGLSVLLFSCKTTAKYEVDEKGFNRRDALCAQRIYIGKPPRRFLDLPTDERTILSLTSAIRRRVTGMRIVTAPEQAQVVLTFISTSNSPTHAVPGPDDSWAAMLAPASMTCEAGTCGYLGIIGENRLPFTPARSFADVLQVLRENECSHP